MAHPATVTTNLLNMKSEKKKEFGFFSYFKNMANFEAFLWIFPSSITPVIVLVVIVKGDLYLHKL